MTQRWRFLTLIILAGIVYAGFAHEAATNTAKLQEVQKYSTPAPDRAGPIHHRDQPAASKIHRAPPFSNTREDSADGAVETIYQDALELANQGDWHGVAQRGESLLSHYPHSQKGYLVLAKARQMLNESPLEVLNVYLEGLRHRPEDRELSDIAWQYFQDEQLPALYPGFDSLDQAHGEQYRFVAAKLAEAGRFEDAIQAKMVYIDREPSRLHREYEDLAAYHLQLGALQKALSALRAARDYRDLYPEDLNEDDLDGRFERSYLDLLLALDYTEEAKAYDQRAKHQRFKLPDYLDEPFESHSTLAKEDDDEN